MLVSKKGTMSRVECFLCHCSSSFVLLSPSVPLSTSRSSSALFFRLEEDALDPFFSIHRNSEADHDEQVAWSFFLSFLCFPCPLSRHVSSPSSHTRLVALLSSLLSFLFSSVIRSQREALAFRTFHGRLTLPWLLRDVDGRPINENEADVFPCGLQSVSIFNDEFGLFRRRDNTTASKPSRPQSQLTELEDAPHTPGPWWETQKKLIEDWIAGRTARDGRNEDEALDRDRETNETLSLSRGEVEGGIRRALQEEEEAAGAGKGSGRDKGTAGRQEEIFIDSSDIAYHWDFSQFMVPASTILALPRSPVLPCLSPPFSFSLCRPHILSSSLHLLSSSLLLFALSSSVPLSLSFSLALSRFLSLRAGRSRLQCLCVVFFRSLRPRFLWVCPCVSVVVLWPSSSKNFFSSSTSAEFELLLTHSLPHFLPSSPLCVESLSLSLLSSFPAFQE